MILTHGPGADNALVGFQASDADEGENARLAFSITAGDSQGLFAIDAVTGALSLTAPLDYERMAPQSDGRYTLTVTAFDSGVPQRSSTTSVTITVQVQVHSAFSKKENQNSFRINQFWIKQAY